MSIPDFTTVVGVDQEHLQQLRLVWPTWRRHRHEILAQPLLLICDDALGERAWSELLSFVDHPDKRIVRWGMELTAQREKMLTGLVLATAQHVDTPWYLKLDTDTVAVKRGAWLQDAWFAPDGRRMPAFIASPWGYTKPPDAIDRLDAWARAVPALARFDDLAIHPQPGWGLVRHPRIISWCFFGQSEWTRGVADYCQGRLPVPSQDTYLWYCAARQGDFYRRIRMKDFGWDHVRRTKRIAELCTSSLST